jgi:ion channel-forming bestrophin family protein
MASFQEPLQTRGVGGLPIHQPTFPMSHSQRRKPRRWPLVLRVWKGSIHLDVLPAVLGHAAFTALIVYLERHHDAQLALPSTIVPSLSIVVGLMLVFRNGSSFDRFW